MKHRIGNNRVVKIEINTSPVFQHCAQWRTVGRRYFERNKTVRSHFIHVGIGQQDIVKNKGQDTRAAEVPFVRM